MFCENIPQDWCNFPVEVTEENKEQLYEIGIKMMSMLKLTGVAVCLYAGISGNLSPAPMWPVWILIGGCFGIVIWGIRAMKKPVRISEWMIKRNDKNKRGMTGIYGRYKNR